VDILRSSQTDLLRMAITRCTLLAKARIRLDANPLDLLLAPKGAVLRIHDPAVVAFIGALRMEGIALEFKVRPRKPEGQVLCLMVGRGEGQVCVPLKAWLAQGGDTEASSGVPEVDLRDILGGLFTTLTALHKPVVAPAPTSPVRQPSLAIARRLPRTEVLRVQPR